jgi:calcineurin-like phosphoesterase family protein
MNTQLIKNWNRVVGKNDIVYYLGDFARYYPKKYLRELNGTIFFILGNHDTPSLIKADIHPVLRRHIIHYKGENILLVHDPREINNPVKWNGWAIHGHTHNNEMSDYPPVNYKRKTLNVSCELRNYTPIELSELLETRRKKNVR